MNETKVDPTVKVRKMERVVECFVTVEPKTPVTYRLHWESDEAFAGREVKAYEEWAKELEGFFHDHRHQDVNAVSVKVVKETVCSKCKNLWETAMDDDTKKVVCAWCGEEVEP
jgi:hypothetical protein